MGKGLYLGCFLLGMAAGAAVSWTYLKEKYEQIAQDEIDSVKAVFGKKADMENVEEEVKMDTIQDRPEEKPNLIEYAKRLRESGYTDRNEENDMGNRPYVISPAEFGENEDYDSISLVYYSDGIVADEDDEILEDLDSVIGMESLEHFGEYEKDSVFVRNDERRCDYEILADHRTYEEVTGNQVET